MEKFLVKFSKTSVLTKLEEKGVISYYPMGQEESVLQIVFVKNVELEELKAIDGVMEVRKTYKGKLIKESH